jgi:hypothetical protein
MKTEINGRVVKLPDFLIVGAARSGTTSLYNYLGQHPEIFLPDIKEPGFFAFSEKPTHFPKHPGVKIVWKFEDYLRLFDPVGEGQVSGEASTFYLYFYEETIKNIKQYVHGWQDMKIIILLRNPVERAFSTHTLFRLAGLEHLKFENTIERKVLQDRMANGWNPAVDYIGYGFYYKQVEAYLKTFSNTKIFLFEDIKTNARDVTRDIFRLVGVDDSFVPDMSEKHNVSGAPRFKVLHKLLRKPELISSVVPFIRMLIPLEKRINIVNKIERKNLKRIEMQEVTRRYLTNLYREDILKLQRLIGRNLSSWL